MRSAHISEMRSKLKLNHFTECSLINLSQTGQVPPFWMYCRKATFQSCNCKFTITHTTIVIDLSYNDVKRRKKTIYATNRLFD